MSSDDVVTTFGTAAMTAFRLDGEVLWSLPLATGDCSRLAASGVQRLVICGDENGRLRRWDLDTGEPIGRPWEYQLGGGGDIALADDESEILLMSAISPSIPRLRIDGGGPAARTIGGLTTRCSGASTRQAAM